MAAKNSSAHSVVTPQELAQILALSEREILRLTATSVLTRTTALVGGRQRLVYDWRENVRRYCVHVRKPREESREGYAEEKRLTQAIVRQQKELELGVARGDMVRRARVVFVMTNYFSTIKNHVLAIPARCARQLLGKRDVPSIRAVLDTACRDCLRETSSFGAHSFDETSKNGTHAQEGAGLARIRARVKRRRRKS